MKSYYSIYILEILKAYRLR